MPVRLVSVSAGEVGTFLVLHTRVVPAGLVPALIKSDKLTVVVGQVLVNDAGAKTGAVVPAKQGAQVVATATMAPLAVV